MKLYFISGLGADQRVFARMKFEDHEILHIHWIPPHKMETLPAYAKRLGEQVDTESDFALIGVSFGGMLATELSTWLQPKATILISSTPTLSALSKLRQVFRYIPISSKILRASLPVFRWLAPVLFGVKDKEDKHFLRQIITETDPQFVAWAVSAILRWKRKQAPPGIIRIHGKGDLLIPALFEKNLAKLDGGHFIVWQKAAEIQEIIKSHLDTVI